MTEIIETYGIWVMIGICFAGGYYAKGTLGDAMLYTFIAPMFFVPAGITIGLAGAGVAICIRAVAPKLYLNLSTISSDLGIYPVAILTIASFLGFCHYERINRGLPSGYRARSKQTGDSNPLSRTLRH